MLAPSSNNKLSQQARRTTVDHKNDGPIIYFCSSVGKLAFAQIDLKTLKNYPLLELRIFLFEKNQHQHISRIYYKNSTNDNDGRDVVSVGNDTELKKMYEFFSTTTAIETQQKTVFVEFEDAFILKKLHHEGYRDVKKIRGGERSNIYTASYKGETVAVKITKNGKREVSKVLALGLYHPNVISAKLLIDFEDAFDNYVQSYTGYQMQYYQRGDMSKIKKPLSEVSLLIIAMKIASVLLFFQQKKHVHCDLKENNFLIGKIERRCGIEIIDAILADLEYSHSLDSILLCGEDGSFSKDILEFGYCLLAFANESKELSYLISTCKIRTIEEREKIQKTWKNSTDLLNFIFRMISEDEINRPKIEEVLQEFTSMAVKLNTCSFDYADISLRTNENFVEKMMAIDPKAFKYAHEDLRSNKIFVRGVLGKYPQFVEYIDDSLKSDYSFMEPYVRKNGLLLEYAGSNLKRNPDFVKIAIDQTVYAIRYVRENFEGYEKLLLSCVQANGLLLKFALVKTEEIVIAAVSNNSGALENISTPISPTTPTTPADADCQ